MAQYCDGMCFVGGIGLLCENERAAQTISHSNPANKKGGENEEENVHERSHCTHLVGSGVAEGEHQAGANERVAERGVALTVARIGPPAARR